VVQIAVSEAKKSAREDESPENKLAAFTSSFSPSLRIFVLRGWRGKSGITNETEPYHIALNSRHWRTLVRHVSSLACSPSRFQLPPFSLLQLVQDACTREAAADNRAASLAAEKDLLQRRATDATKSSRRAIEHGRLGWRGPCCKCCMMPAKRHTGWDCGDRHIPFLFHHPSASPLSSLLLPLFSCPAVRACASMPNSPRPAATLPPSPSSSATPPTPPPSPEPNAPTPSAASTKPWRRRRRPGARRPRRAPMRRWPDGALKKQRGRVPKMRRRWRAGAQPALVCTCALSRDLPLAQSGKTSGGSGCRCATCLGGWEHALTGGV